MSTQPLDDRDIGPDEALRAHFGMIHQLAVPFAGGGKLIVASFGEDPAGIHPKTGKPGRPIDPRINHPAIGNRWVIAEADLPAIAQALGVAPPNAAEPATTKPARRRASA